MQMVRQLRLFLVPVVGVIVLVLGTVAVADTTHKATVLFGGKRAGEQVTRTGDDGSVVVDYSYRDNGRGPTLKEQIRLGTDGTIDSYKVSGTSTFGAPVNEFFSRKAGKAQWRSSSDQGGRPVGTPAIYVPVNSSQEVTAIIARAIARQPAKRLPALPAGELALEKLVATAVTSGERRIDVALHASTGLSTEPDFIWLTADPEQRFFAYLYPGYMQIVAEGFEAQAPMLEELQKNAERQWLERLATKLTHHLPEPVLLRDVRVFDSKEARLGPAADVYVWNGRVGAIYPPNSPAREAATVIEGGGRVLMPGLFDMHSHESNWNLLLQLAGGVTTSRDMGNDNASLWQLIHLVQAGRLAGPRIVPTGYIEGESPFSSVGGFLVKDLQGAKDAIDWYAERGYHQIKIYNSFRPEWVAPAAAYAHERGLRVGGHIPAFMRAEEAIRAGYDEVQHINQLTLNFFVGPKDDTRTLARFYLIGDHAHELDLDSKAVKDFIVLMKEHGTTLDATLATFEGMFNQKQGETDPAYAAIADHLPVGLQREMRTNSMNITEANVAKYRASYAKLVEFVGRLHREGIPLVAGTDAIAGFTLHRELELYVRAGIPAGEALRIATWNGAKYAGVLDEVGSIEAHKGADLILVDGDPTTKISDIRRISLVMREGTAYFPSEIYAALGVKPFVDPPRMQSTTESAPADR